MSASSAPRTRVVVRQWHLFDASNQTVGRLAQRIAHLLMGKHQPTFNPNQDSGDTVTVINSEKVEFTGNRWNKKVYRYHSGFPGGLKEIPAAQMVEKHPTHILRHAVAGMIPQNKFKHERLERLKLFVGPHHAHPAQLPVDALSELAKLKQEAEQKLEAIVGHEGMLPRFDPADIGTKHLPTDPTIRADFIKFREKEEADQKAWLAAAQPDEEAKDTQGSRKARMRGVNLPFIPPSKRDLALGYLPKQSKKRQ